MLISREEVIAIDRLLKGEERKDKSIDREPVGKQIELPKAERSSSAKNNGGKTSASIQ